jgi:uncharacterized protein (TIGR02270 family)
MLQHLASSPVVLEGAVHQHIANASQFLVALRAVPFQIQNNNLFGNLSFRCEANLDGLRIAGRAAVEMVQASIPDDSEVASVLALLLTERVDGQPEASAQAVSLLRHENPEIRQAAWWGLRLASPRHLEQHLRALLGNPKWDFASAAALDILAFHRLPSQPDLGDLTDAESDEVAWLLAEAGCRMDGAWSGARLKQFIGRPSTRVREASLRASARCGLPELLTFCREATSQINPAAPESISFLGVVGSLDDLSLLQRAASNPVTANAAISGLGRLGSPASVPTLLDLMEVPELTDYAAAAIKRITGQAVPRSAPPQPPADLSEDELDLWEPKPPVDVARANDWWKSNAARFDPSKRWQAGLCVSDDPLGSVFDQLPLGIRYDVYLRQRAFVPSTPDWELETWTWKQKNPGG